MRILLVEDEPDMGATIKEILNREKYVVDWVQDGAEAWEYIQDRLADYSLAIFDWSLPGLTGLELCQRLRNRKNPLPILVLTAKDKIEDRVSGLDAGADDYLVKPFSIPELLARVRALQRRSPLLQPSRLQVDGLILDCGTRIAYWQSLEGQIREISLTNKEFQILEYLMKYPRQVIQSDRIRRQIWEINDYSYSNVVAAQVRRLRRKLASIDCNNIIETVPGLGYRLNPEP
ncbi:two-component system response regulator RppA [Myxosarcina sp. GI1]|uniref:two-component system response regulator RppA n=1 Tax=Myxosarcina sp. GI1 TaxID=1541065 RepID=UPI000560FCB3|nr:two-component system response regulator RppA [Myxosarcina sp. GI1]